MNKTIAALGIYFIVIFLSGCATTSHFMDKTTGISENSSDAMYGVRLYQGKLPSSIVYRFLGEVEGTSKNWEVVHEIMEAREDAVLKAKKLGANALINIKLVNTKGRLAYKGEAVLASEYPDKFDEFDSAVWAPISYENSRVFKFAYEPVFKAVEDILQRELYELVITDQEKGMIETKEIEDSNDRFKWTDADFGGPYPKFKIKVVVKKVDENSTQVTEIDIVRGSHKKAGIMNKSSKIFFKEIEDYLKAN